MSTLSNTVRYTGGNSNRQAIRQKKERKEGRKGQKKGHPEQKEKNKTILLTDNMIAYTENPKECTKKTTGTNNKNVYQGHRI